MLVDFHGIFIRYAEDVYRFALYLSGDRSLAEDIMQETFVRAWVTPGGIRESTVRAYLLAIARNLYRDQLKRNAREVVLDAGLADPKPGPDVLASDRLELRAVLAALQTLPEVDRAALVMSAQDGMSHAEIAASLHLSVVGVKVRIHRARIKLKRILNPEED